MKRERINDVSITTNDALEYSLFPEYRDDRNADMSKLITQKLYLLAEHRKKTCRDMRVMQDILMQYIEVYFLHTHQISA